MKAFIFVALVASVAARSLDLDTLRLIKEQSLLNRPVVNDLLLKEQLGQRLPLEKNLVGDFDRVVPVERELVQGQDLFRGIRDVDQVLTIDELYTTELFREYLTIPLFRQYIQYPVFQRYIASVYFQRFWQLPTFRQYFINPILFHKYIYPIVTLFQNEYSLPLNQETIRGQDLVYGQDTLERQTLENLILKNRNVLPYVYGQQDVYNRIPTVSGQYYPWTTKTTQGINQQWLLNRIIRNLLVKPVEDVQVKTDVVLPVDRQTIVDPITGERKIVEEPRIVDVKVDARILPIDQVLPVERRVVDTIEREQLICQLLIKDLLHQGIITEEILEQVREIPTIRRDVRQILKVLLEIPRVARRVEEILPLVTRRVEEILPLVTRRDQEILPFVTRRDQEVLPFVTRRDQEVLPRLTRQEQEILPLVSRRQQLLTPTLNSLFEGERINNLYNTEIPAIRENTLYNRLPLQQILGNIVA